MGKSGGKQAISPIPSLDGLRAVSIAIVFLSHCGMRQVIPGTFGVTVFFFLSGYLITTLMRQEWAATGQISLRQFYLRRVLRIFPPLYLTVAFASAVSLAGLLPAVLTWKAFGAEAAFLANYYKIGWAGYGMPPGMLVLWSLAVEEHFYLGFPLLFIALQRRSLRPAHQAAVLVALSLLVLGWRYALVRLLGVDVSGTRAGWDPGWHRLAESTDTRIDSILFGCTLAVWGNPAIESSRVPERVWKLVLVPLGLLGLLVSFVYRGPEFRETARYTLQGVALVPIFVGAIRYPQWWLFRPLNWKWVARLGVVSYTFYLIHDTFLETAAHWLGGFTFVGALVALAASLAFCELSYRYVEQPCAALRKRLSASPRGSWSGARRGVPLGLRFAGSPGARKARRRTHRTAVR
jgi:peptidoglycan/LPS O-acetylase OafA/YrhL